MKVTNIPFYLYSIEETDELGREIKSKLTQKWVDHVLITPLINDLEQPLQLTQQAIGSSTKQLHTDTISSLDQQFNRSFIGFRDIIYSYAYSPESEEREASAVLSQILKNNDDKLYAAGYVAQGAKFNSLDVDLNTPAAKTALNILHVTNWYSEMKTMVSEISNLISERDENQSNKDIPTDKQAKTALQDAIDNVLRDLQTYARRNQVEGLTQILTEIDQSIKRINTNARARKSRKENSIGSS
ncbi:hypothetical protein J8281_11415 [Aquimarina sp. U1-2]|uniref:DUF6261 family protein n=1 Tax=Aquimarina sp. U1-2 TaxID=2823141 RepID=UPI001AECFD0C|nr:DUF6261 family protein [Aquimarina sp. U1-2]MBP2832795.1 hypothetical protein [Aquimarina sp. U1-2]